MQIIPNKKKIHYGINNDIKTGQKYLYIKKYLHAHTAAVSLNKTLHQCAKFFLHYNCLIWVGNSS